jgi:hypothetical protein
MEKKDFELIEQRLSIRLPESYRNVFQDNPLANKKKYCDVYESLLDNPNDIIEINMQLRKNGLKKKAWNENFYIIGLNGGGNYYFINLDDSNNHQIYYLSNKDRYNPEKIDKYLAFDDYKEFLGHRIALQSISGFGK